MHAMQVKGYTLMSLMLKQNPALLKELSKPQQRTLFVPSNKVGLHVD